MALWQGKSLRKASGGRYWPMRKKKKSEIGSDPVHTKVGEKTTTRKIRGRGGNWFSSLFTASEANVTDGKKTKKVKILSVSGNTANRHFVRMNIITKGAIIKTDVGEAKVTSRPTRSGVVSAVLVKK